MQAAIAAPPLPTSLLTLPLRAPPVTTFAADTHALFVLETVLIRENPQTINFEITTRDALTY